MKFKYIAAVFLGACSYGIPSTFVKLSYQKGISPAIVTIGQFLAGWFILFLLMLFFKKDRRLEKKEILLLMAAGAPSGLVGIFYYMSLVTVNASIAIILLFQFVWIGVALDSLIHKKWPNKSTILAIVVLLIGTGLASGAASNGNYAIIDLQGFIYGILAAVCFALFILANARVLPDLPPVQRSFHMVSGSLLIVLILFFPSLLGETVRSFQVLGWYGIMLGLFGVFLPPFLFAYGMPKVGSALGSILGSAELPVAVLFSMLILKESVTWLQWGGVLLILAAMVIPNIPYKRKAWSN